MSIKPGCHAFIPFRSEKAKGFLLTNLFYNIYLKIFNMKHAVITSVLIFLLQFTYSQEKVNDSFNFKFTEINIPYKSELRAISAINENTIWASGSEGMVFLTTDGGENWNEFSIPGCEETEFRSLHAWDSIQALVFDVSPLGRGYMTLDGGKTWQIVYESPKKGAFFNSLKFADDLNGIAISDPIDDESFIIKTIDGGKNWIRIENTPAPAEGEINFAASNTCVEYLKSGKIFIVTGGSEARMLTSFDAGNTWEFISTPMTYRDSKGIYSVNFISDKIGAAVGGSFQYPKAQIIRSIYTKDGGKTWKASKLFPKEYRSCVVNVKGKILFTISKTGCDYSTDNGKNWTFINSNGYYAADALEGTNIIFVSGSEGRFAKVVVKKE